MASRRCFTDSDTWNGGFYEIAIELGACSDVRLETALRRVWSFADLAGPYLESSREPTEQQITERIPLEGHLYGLATVDGHGPVACGSVAIRSDAGDDWLHFYLPLGALGTVLPVGAFPFDDGSHESWRRPVDAWLANLGRHVYAAVEFPLGLVGFEPGTVEPIAAATIAKHGLPDRRCDGILVSRSRALAWYPRNQP